MHAHDALTVRTGRRSRASRPSRGSGTARVALSSVNREFGSSPPRANPSRSSRPSAFVRSRNRSSGRTHSHTSHRFLTTTCRTPQQS
jgi:hypothetical protein